MVRLPLEAVASFASDGLLITGPGWAAAHLDQSARIFTNALVRLHHGGDDVAAFTADATRLTGRADIPVKDLRDDSKRVQSSIDVERTALLLFAAAVGLAAAVLVGQAFVRSVRAGADSVPVLGAMGLGRAGLVSGLTAPHLLTLLVALPVAVLSAAAFSTRFPIGLAGRIDPDLGVHVDGLILVVGLAMLAAVIAGLVIGTSWLIVRAASAPRRQGRMRVIGAVGRTGAPLPAAIGASLALEAPPGRSSSSVRDRGGVRVGLAPLRSAPGYAHLVDPRGRDRYRRPDVSDTRVAPSPRRSRPGPRVGKIAPPTWFTSPEVTFMFPTVLGATLGRPTPVRSSLNTLRAQTGDPLAKAPAPIGVRRGRPYRGRADPRSARTRR